MKHMKPTISINMPKQFVSFFPHIGAASFWGSPGDLWNWRLCWATKKTLLLSIESWLVNRDPYNGLLKSLYNWVGKFHPLYTLNNQGFFHCSFIKMRFTPWIYPPHLPPKMRIPHHPG